MQPVQPGSMDQSFLERAIGVLKLDRATYRGIVSDEKALGQAWVIVILAGILNGLGSARQVAKFSAEFQQRFTEATAGQQNVPEIDWSQFNSTGSQISTIITSVIGVIISWLIFSALARWVARAIFGSTDDEIASMSRMMGVVGWAYVPALLGVLGVIPGIGGLLLFIVAIWGLLTQVWSVQAGTGLSTGKSWGAWFIASILPAIILGGLCCVVFGAVLGTAGLFGAFGG